MTENLCYKLRAFINTHALINAFIADNIADWKEDTDSTQIRLAALQTVGVQFERSLVLLWLCVQCCVGLWILVILPGLIRSLTLDSLYCPGTSLPEGVQLTYWFSDFDPCLDSHWYLCVQVTQGWTKVQSSGLSPCQWVMFSWVGPHNIREGPTEPVLSLPAPPPQHSSLSTCCLTNKATNHQHQVAILSKQQTMHSCLPLHVILTSMLTTDNRRTARATE